MKTRYPSNLDGKRSTSVWIDIEYREDVEPQESGMSNVLCFHDIVCSNCLHLHLEWLSPWSIPANFVQEWTLIR